MKWLDARRTHAPLGPFDDDVVTRSLLSCVFLMVAMMVVLIGPWLIDDRLIEGVNPWLKPQKFGVSFIVHFMTLAILAQTLPRQVRDGPTLRIFTYLAVGAIVSEMAYIIVQAARGRRSHFNFDTQIESLMYAMMGLGALLLVFVAMAIGVQILRKGQVGPGLRAGAVTGLIFGAITTIVLAGYMSSFTGSRWVGEHPVGGATVPFFGWSREVGDLRPAHFVAMHMMQTMPLFGWSVDKLGMSRGPALLAVAIALFAQIGLAVFLFMQALAGEPFWPV